MPGPEALTEEVEALAARAVAVDDQIDDRERDAAKMLPIVMRRVKDEVDEAASTAIAVVAIPIDETEATGAEE